MFIFGISCLVVLALLGVLVYYGRLRGLSFKVYIAYAVGALLFLSIVGVVLFTPTEEYEVANKINPIDLTEPTVSGSAIVEDFYFDDEVYSSYVLKIHELQDDGTSIRVTGYVGDNKLFFYVNPRTVLFDLDGGKSFSYTELQVGQSYFVYGIGNLSTGGLDVSAIVRTLDPGNVYVSEVTDCVVSDGKFVFTLEDGSVLSSLSVIDSKVGKVTSTGLLEFPQMLIGYLSGEDSYSLEVSYLLPSTL